METIIAEAKDLPPTPKILPKLQKILRDPDSGIHQIIELIRLDAPLAAQVVRVSNSAWFGGAKRTENLTEAINRLGFQEVYKVVSMVSSNQLLGAAQPVYNLRSGELWERSVVTAVIMEALAGAGCLDTDNAYTIGLFCDIGKVIVNGYCMERGLQIYADNPEEDDDTPLPEVERQILGFTHAEVSAGILRKWGFAESIVEPIACKFEPFEANEHRRKACLLQFAIAGNELYHLNHRSKLPCPSLCKRITDGLGMAPVQIEGAFEEAEAHLHDYSDLFKAA